MAEFFELDASDKNNKKLIIGNLIGATEWMKFRQKMEKDPENAEYKPYRYVKCVEVHGDFTIPDHAFENFIRLTEVISTGPGLGVGRSAFEGCESLQTVNAPKLDFIGAKAFAGCKNLQTVGSSNIKFIGEEAFSGCSKLTGMDLPIVEIMEKNAFKDCTGLKEIKGLGKLKDINSVYNLGCSEKLFENNEFVNLSRLKGSYKMSTAVRDGRVYLKYKEFKKECNSKCNNGIAKENSFKLCANSFLDVLELMKESLKKRVKNVLENNSNIKIDKKYFSDFKQLIMSKCEKILDKISGNPTRWSLEDTVYNEVKELQANIKKYVLAKYNGLLKAGLEDEDVIKNFGEYFRVLLGFAGLEKLKNIDAKEVKRNKCHSSFDLGGGGLDLLVMVKECELKGIRESKKD